MSNALNALFSITIQRFVASDGRVTNIYERPLPQQGYSGATIRIYDVEFETVDGRRTIALATKDARSVERRVLQLLAEQGHVVVPYALSIAPDDEERALVCMRAITHDDSGGEAAVERTAVALAGIHAANMGQRERLGWLPPADRAYMNGGYVLETWRTSWSQTMQDAAFAQQYGAYEAALKTAADQFLDDMTTLWNAGDTLTLIHGDLHDGNVMVEDGSPYIIDWEQALYGTLYYDLPNHFSPAQSLMYRDALAERGYVIARDDFERGYVAASRMIGFKYMGFWLTRWRQGGADREQSHDVIRALIDTAINGSR